MKHLFLSLVMVTALVGCEQKTDTPASSAPTSASGMNASEVDSLVGMASSPILTQTPVTPYAEAREVRLYVAQSGTTADLSPTAKYVSLTPAQRETLNSAFSYIERENPENAVHFGPATTVPRYLFRFVDASGNTLGDVHLSFCGEAITSAPEIFTAPPATGARPFVNYDTLKGVIADTRVADITACS